MAVNITERIEELADELSRLTGESATEAVERALLERKKRVQQQPRQKQPETVQLTPEQQKRMDDYLDFMEKEVWSRIPKHLLGKSISKEEREDILGIGPDGYPV